MRRKLKTILIALLILGGFAGTAEAVTCTTSTPVNGTTVSDATGVIGGGGTYNAVGTADCPDQPGPQGEQGVKGDKGDTGAQGEQGATGATGPQGVAGAQGVQGEKGDKGDTGATGATGTTGVQGIQGVKGDKGDKGFAGLDGEDGRDGKDFDPSQYQEGLATIGALNIPHVEKNFAASGSAGFFNDKTAIGGGAALRIDQTWQIGGSIAVGTSGGDVAGKAAITGQW